MPQLPGTCAPSWKELTPVMVYDLTPDPAGPTGDDLAAIEAEWPLIEAEMALVDAEIRMLTVQGAPSPLDWRRLRRAEARVMREALAVAAHLPLSDLAA
jgi:Family of unknown function (DUF6284)